MKFQKGQPRPPNAGRKKGSKNKRTLLLEEIFEKAPRDPLEEMIALAYDARTPVAIRAGLLKEICSYKWPKPKPTEESDLQVDFSTMPPEQFEKLMNQLGYVKKAQ